MAISPETPRRVYSITALNRAAKVILEQEFPLVWVEGEVSNLSRPASGHLYFSLKDEHAQIRCALFKSRARLLRHSPENGARVVARARVTLYEGRGDFQLVVEHLEPAGTGALQQAFEALKSKLELEGLFAREHKKSLPRFPERLGVITSPSGAVIRDILNVLRRRCPGLPVRIYPVPVQGKDAPPAITAALRQAARRQDCEVLILARGGGSLEDLWAFNDEQVARVIHACPIPVISAVGHETDFTIADFVADLRAPTPSAAAELASPDQTDWLERVQALEQRLIRHQRQQLDHLGWRLRALRGRLPHPRQRLQTQMQRADHLESRLRLALAAKLENRRQREQRLALRLAAHHPRALLAPRKQRLAQAQKSLPTLIRQHLASEQTHLATLNRALHTVSPLATLERGYAIAWDQHHQILRDTDALSPNDAIRLKLARGELECQVISTHGASK